MTKAANLLRTGIGLAALLAATVTLAADPQPWQLNMGPGVSDVSREVYWLHNYILIICTVVGLLVFAAMGYAIFKFRKSKGAVAATFSHNTTAEVIWTVIPVIILIAVAWPSTTTLFTARIARRLPCWGLAGDCSLVTSMSSTMLGLSSAKTLGLRLPP